EVVKRTARCNPAKEFIRDLDRLSPIKIPHNAAFRTFQSGKDFRELWNRQRDEEFPELEDVNVDDPELELAVRFLSNHDKRECAEGLIRAWWAKHDIEPDEITLIFALDEAWRLTEEKRRNFYMKREEQRIMNRRPRTRDRVLEYLSERPGTAAE